MTNGINGCVSVVGKPGTLGAPGGGGGGHLRFYLSIVTVLFSRCNYGVAPSIEGQV